MRILYVEDDPATRAHVVRGLREAGHEIAERDNGDAALLAASHESFDLLIVDRMIPGVDGLQLIKALRAMGVETPALVLSALGEVDHRVEGLRAGSDDYLAKPFAMVELLARIEALARRAGTEREVARLSEGDLVLDLLKREAARDGQSLSLQPREFELLEYLLRHAGQVVTRSMLLEQVWGIDFDPQTNVVDVHISRLRQKLDRGFPVPLLHTIRGRGYVLSAER